MKNNAGGIWFSAKRAEIARKMFTKEINETIKHKSQILKQINNNSALNSDTDLKSKAFDLTKYYENQGSV